MGSDGKSEVGSGMAEFNLATQQLAIQLGFMGTVKVRVLLSYTAKCGFWP